MKHRVYRLTLGSFLLFILIAQSPAHTAVATNGHTDKVAVLMYHHLDNSNTNSLTITPALFRQQLTFLKSKGYHFISLHDFRLFMQGGPVPSNAVLITFDDGYESFYTQAYPILKELSVPAVNFVVTNYLLEVSPYLPHLSVDQIHAMRTEPPNIDFQCHTHDMHKKAGRKSYLTAHLVTATGKESQQMYENRVLQDTSTCLQLLNKVGMSELNSFSYPYGIYNSQLSVLLLESGIRYAFTIHPGLASRGVDHLEIPRINAGSASISAKRLYQMINHLN
ncbi:polysaccharide deacetylase [Paenibacillus baekrokdamisoli]|uniref:Polysaccharide deacetylase n=1 Tax=Paenibacillus baekrokdamisoli TaxID=1712516 RepID=A0A3G9JFW8_9BACL|nr:polysaccharide deacetylase family protein [Paenibacillus baekrokdamisoli]MBB3068004.1 peptidoglycan/xylan/chitin deacetylase (PgdA/CDA1 family) [Paenibacillus baekrokdamisoli]BBH22948.1 polysaccharide deacetylase [Paenibacillus baekrokdamisoli]